MMCPAYQSGANLVARSMPNLRHIAEPEYREGNAGQRQSSVRLAFALGGNALQRIASGASGVLIGLYLADLANHGSSIGAALVGTLGAVSFAAELAGAIPLGIASDAVAPRALMVTGSLLGAAAAQLFGMTGFVSIFFLSRGLEGLGASAVTPPLLAHLTDVTDHNASLRAKAMSYFELSLLAGLALGGLVGGEFWRWGGTKGFPLVAVMYISSAALLYFGAAGSRSHGRSQALAGFFRALRQPSLRRLAPVWLCVNAIVGLWLGPTLIFLLTHNPQRQQFLDGVLVFHPERVGWVLLAYSVVFGIGVMAWSFVLPRFTRTRALRITLLAMLLVCGEFFVLNHTASERVHWIVGGVIAISIMVESGFTPAALALLADAIGAQAGRGAAMGIYSVLLSVGAIGGSLMAAGLGARLAIDGLILGTLALAIVALILVRRLEPAPGILAAERP
ncbi:MAG TPA: MFS transporter [Terriglobales bacterium]|nr:MFS transporter [Terriglobales bacterium]